TIAEVVLPAASVAVAMIALSPEVRGTKADQVPGVSEARPVPPVVRLSQRTSETSTVTAGSPPRTSEAVPLMAKGVSVVLKAGVAGVVKAIVGAFGSYWMVIYAVEVFPTVSVTVT